MTDKKAPRAPSSILRGLTVQLFAVTVLPLSLLLLVIAFGGVSLHQQDMRTLVGERDERAVRSSAAALESELHHRMATISGLLVLAGESRSRPLEELFSASNDLTADFEGGMALFGADGDLIAGTEQDGSWDWVARKMRTFRFASALDPGPVITGPLAIPNSKRIYVVISEYSPSLDMIAVGVFSPESLAAQALSTSHPVDSQLTVYLVDSSRRVLFSSSTSEVPSLSADHPGVAEALRGESGTLYVTVDDSEHAIAYSPVSPAGWALITEEAWQAVVSPSLQATQMAPLVLVPAILLALIALWFVAGRIVQPLQKLEAKAAALAWGDFEAIKEPVGGIAEVQHLQVELTEMARKVQAAQEGLRGYIGAITSAQEEERRRLARELHDDTIQAVIALKQRVQLAHKSVRAESGHRALRELETLAEETVENLRRLTRALRPIYLEDLGLVTALEMLASETCQGNSIIVDFHRSGEEQRLSPGQELALYRIAQEALNNVVRHSKAKHADLRIAFGVKEVKLEVGDNGVGFEAPWSPTDLTPGGHFGLLGMRERADLIGAKLEVRSEAGHGTRLSVKLALPANGSEREE